MANILQSTPPTGDPAGKLKVGANHTNFKPKMPQHKLRHFGKTVLERFYCFLE